MIKRMVDGLSGPSLMDGRGLESELGNLKCLGDFSRLEEWPSDACRQNIIKVGLIRDDELECVRRSDESLDEQ
jgi:hypothetical protein